MESVIELQRKACRAIAEIVVRFPTCRLTNRYPIHRGDKVFRRNVDSSYLGTNRDEHGFDVRERTAQTIVAQVIDCDLYTCQSRKSQIWTEQ